MTHNKIRNRRPPPERRIPPSIDEWYREELAALRIDLDALTKRLRWPL